MRIEHLAMWVSDLENMKLFYTAYFNGTANEKYTNSLKKFESYFVSFEGGARLELMRRPEIQSKENDAVYSGYAHVAFSVGSKEKVIELTETFRKEGYTIASEARTTGDGYFESSILDPEGNLVEITI
jgi:lactoylglutathione lyase